VPLTRSALRLVHLRAGPHELAAARIAIGLCGVGAAWEAWRTLSRILDPLVVPLPYVGWVPRMSPGAVAVLGTVWLAASAAFVLGFRTRMAGAVITSLAAYTLLLDQRTYSNHLYLFVLVALLLTVADSGAAFSLDARRAGPPRSVAAWPIVLLRIQVSLVYGFAAIAKLTPQFLSGDVLLPTLRTQGMLTVPVAWRTPAPMGLLALTAIALELFLAVGLWSDRLRWIAVVAGALLHGAILTLVASSRLSLGIFAVEMIALYPLFFQRLAPASSR
jgi:vitamin K-dependent gamma-carboxylase-like protein